MTFNKSECVCFSVCLFVSVHRPHTRDPEQRISGPSISTSYLSDFLSFGLGGAQREREREREREDENDISN